jgi:hypothetical protein
MSVPGKSVGYQSYKKTRTNARDPDEDERRNEDLSKEVEEVEQRIQEAQKRVGTLSKATGQKDESTEGKIGSYCVEEMEEQKRKLRGIFREQEEPFDKFSPVEEPMIYSFRRLEELVTFKRHSIVTFCCSFVNFRSVLIQMRFFLSKRWRLRFKELGVNGSIGPKELQARP